MDNAITRCDVSVIIAAYNVERYIERAARSALEQRNVDVEVIVIDDASSDNTVAIVETMKDQRIKLLRMATNEGPSAARNAGLAVATGSWIAILDGDDAFAPDRLNRCLTLAYKTKADIVVDNLEVHREADGKRYPMFDVRYIERRTSIDLAEFIRRNVSLMGGMSLGYMKPLISTSFLRKKQLSYDPDIRIGEDYLLLAEALALGAKCVIDPNAGYLYTARVSSISHRLTVGDVDRMIASDRKFLAKHVLTPTAQCAQNRRAKNQLRMRAFVQLVDAIKQKSAAAALGIALHNPLTTIQLWRPVWARIQRLYK